MNKAVIQRYILDQHPQGLSGLKKGVSYKNLFIVLYWPVKVSVNVTFRVVIIL